MALVTVVYQIIFFISVHVYISNSLKKLQYPLISTVESSELENSPEKLLCTPTH
jgi:hypothetical protein